MKFSGILVTAALMLAVSVPADAQWGSPERQLATLMERETYDILKDKWSAAWIEVPGSDPEEYGVYYFRKDVELADAPGSFVIHVSADQRYKLYVNGTLVSLGPARNDSKRIRKPVCHFSGSPLETTCHFLSRSATRFGVSPGSSTSAAAISTTCSILAACASVRAISLIRVCIRR